LRPLVIVALAAAIAATPTLRARAGDPVSIDAYVTPYYSSSGPQIRIGKFSAGLATANQGKFVATILQMKKQWAQLNFVELYVSAIRLYDMGYRREATYWFYTAQYKGRQFGVLVDRYRLGNIGDPGFELYHAQDAFFELVGPDINGYAFGNLDSLLPLIRKVQRENRTVGNLHALYPGVVFKSQSEWQMANATLNAGLGQLADQLATQKSQIAAQRNQNGAAARFSHVTSKEFPGGV
jgi:hypothetical protein